jgi:hypothetical protein
VIHVGVNRLSPLWIESFLENPALNRLAIRCQSNHDVYACSHGGVAMSGGNGMHISSRVPIARRMWEPLVASCLV